MDSLSSRVDGNAREIKALSQQVTKDTRAANMERVNTKSELLRLENKIKERDNTIRTEIARAVREVVGEEISSIRVGEPANESNHTVNSDQIYTVRQVNKYWECRRALRIWPVSGSDMRTALERFLLDKMGLDQEFVRDLGHTDVIRLSGNNAGGTKNKNFKNDEVLVTFANKETRDAVKQAGVNLASHRDSAGIRIQVPGHLMSTFRAFESLAYHLKQKDGELRRVVKFDDDNLNLYMDVKLFGSWRRILPEEATKARLANPKLRSGPDTLTSGAISDILGQEAPYPATGSNSVPLGGE